MSLIRVCQEFSERLALLPGITEAPWPPPPKLVSTTTLIVYPSPAATTTQVHHGKNRTAILSHRDIIQIELHRKGQTDAYGSWIPWAAGMVDMVRQAVWSEYKRNKFGESITGIYSTNVDYWGKLVWAGEDSYGFRMSVDLQHDDELSADLTS